MKWKTILARAWVLLVIIVFIGCIYNCRDVQKYFHNKKKHSSQSYPKISENINGLPKGYLIEFNKDTGQYRWCKGNWFKYCSSIPHNTKEETVRWAVANQKYLDTGNNNKWSPIKK